MDLCHVRPHMSSYLRNSWHNCYKDSISEIEVTGAPNPCNNRIFRPGSSSCLTCCDEWGFNAKNEPITCWNNLYHGQHINHVFNKQAKRNVNESIVKMSNRYPLTSSWSYYRAIFETEAWMWSHIFLCRNRRLLIISILITPTVLYISGYHQTGNWDIMAGNTHAFNCGTVALSGIRQSGRHFNWPTETRSGYSLSSLE